MKSRLFGLNRDVTGCESDNMLNFGTRLLYPVSRYQQDVELVGHGADVEKVQMKLKEINRSYLEKSKLYDKYYENYQNASQDILLKRQVEITLGIKLRNWSYDRSKVSTLYCS